MYHTEVVKLLYCDMFDCLFASLKLFTNKQQEILSCLSKMSCSHFQFHSSHSSHPQTCTLLHVVARTNVQYCRSVLHTCHFWHFSLMFLTTFHFVNPFYFWNQMLFCILSVWELQILHNVTLIEEMYMYIQYDIIFNCAFFKEEFKFFYL